jgi:hypothetical protein
MVSGLWGCTSGTTAIKQASPTARKKIPAANITPQPSPTEPPTPANLPVEGLWRAKAVDQDWMMEFEISHGVGGKVYFRLVSIPVIQCGDTKIRELPWQPSVEIINGKLMALNTWSFEDLSPDRIQGTRHYPDCKKDIKWVATIEQPADQMPSPTP